MAVIVANRKPSGVQFIDTAFNLAEHSIKYTNKKFAKKDMDIVRRIRNLSFDILSDVKFANSIYGDSDDVYEERRKRLMTARANCYVLASILTVSMHFIQNDISAFGWNRWGELINEEVSLLTNLMKSDKGKQNNKKIDK